jgi:hypothetical protein
MGHMSGARRFFMMFAYTFVSVFLVFGLITPVVEPLIGLHPDWWTLPAWGVSLVAGVIGWLSEL